MKVCTVLMLLALATSNASAAITLRLDHTATLQVDGAHLPLAGSFDLVPFFGSARYFRIDNISLYGGELAFEWDSSIPPTTLPGPIPYFLSSLFDVELDDAKNIHSMSAIGIKKELLSSYDNVFVASIIALEPKGYLDPASNRIVFGSDEAVSSALLTYQLREMTWRVEELEPVPDVLASRWDWSKESDEIIATFAISAVPVPIPACSWLFTAAAVLVLRPRKLAKRAKRSHHRQHPDDVTPSSALTHSAP